MVYEISRFNAGTNHLDRKLNVRYTYGFNDRMDYNLNLFVKNMIYIYSIYYTSQRSGRHEQHSNYRNKNTLEIEFSYWKSF